MKRRLLGLTINEVTAVVLAGFFLAIVFSLILGTP